MNKSKENNEKVSDVQSSTAEINPGSCREYHGRVGGTACQEGFECDPKWTETYLKLAEVIRQAAPDMIIANGGVKLLNVSTVLDEIYKLPLGTLDPIPAYETVEKCLGEEGLRLPFIEIDEMWYFALYLVDADEEEKAKVQEWLDALSPVERMGLEVR
jgi:hypothetical protein